MVAQSSYPVLGGGVPAAVGMGLPLPERPEQPSHKGPLSAEFIKRLHDQVAMAERELETFREQNKSRQELYSGHGHGANEEAVDTPLNVYNLALRIYQRRLISGDPRVLVRSRSPKAHPEAYELSLACEQLFREIALKDTLKEVVHQGLESVGILKVGVVSPDMHEAGGFLHDGDQPFCDPILLENFAYDTNAKRWEEIDWAGDKYRVAVSDLIGNPQYNQDIVRSMDKGEQRQDEDLRHSTGEESVQRLGVQQSVFRDELRQYVTVWDIWLPRVTMPDGRRGVIVTIPADGQSPPIRVEKWDGPENGPYHLLRFDPIPGNIMPVSPGGHLESLAKLLNRAIRKLGNQLDRQRTNPTITPASANAGDDKTIQDAMDGDVLQLMDPKNVGEVRVGGIDQQSYAFTQGLLDLYQWLGGNLNSLGGLASNAATASQQEMELSGANGLIDELQDRFMTFLKGVCTDLAWYEYTDPTRIRKLTKRVQGTDIELPDRAYGPERRQRPFFLFEFEVDPFSVRHRTPEQRLQMILELLPRMAQIGQAAMVYSQAGIELDVEGLWRMITRYTGFTELSEIIRASGQSITAEPRKLDRLPSANVGGMPREYIRRNVSSGGEGRTGMAPGQQALQTMLAAGNGNGAAG
jgi:hypothetical protein